MVQSGKTASMTIISRLSYESGYRLFILLSGDKNSLRDQTQDRVNSAFDLNFGGYNTSLKLKSLTTKGNDYNDNRDKYITSDQFLEINRHKNETFIIVIKKNKSNLIH